MFRRLAKFRALPPLERCLLLEALLELARASLALRLFSWRRASQGLMAVEGGTDAGMAGLIGHSVTIAARHAPWRPTCLRQALATQRMLRRRGLAGRIEISFPDPKNKTHAHAWVLSGSERLLTR